MFDGPAGHAGRLARPPNHLPRISLCALRGLCVRDLCVSVSLWPFSDFRFQTSDFQGCGVAAAAAGGCTVEKKPIIISSHV